MKQYFEWRAILSGFVASFAWLWERGADQYFEWDWSRGILCFGIFCVVYGTLLLVAHVTELHRGK